MDSNKSNEISDELINHFLDLYKIAFCDNNIDPKELSLLYTIGIEKGVNQVSMDEIVKLPYRNNAVIPNDPIQKISYLYDYAKMIIADNEIKNEELNLLKKICNKFNFKEENINEIVDFILDQCKNGSSKEAVIEIVKQTL